MRSSVNLISSALDDCEISSKVFFYSVKVRNVQQVIRLTKENLDELDRHFGGVKHPPSMILEVN